MESTNLGFELTSRRDWISLTPEKRKVYKTAVHVLRGDDFCFVLEQPGLFEICGKKILCQFMESLKLGFEVTSREKIGFKA
jgi:hypothetical protein